MQRPLCELGFPGPVRDTLVAAVLDGSKTATSSLLEQWDADDEVVPVAGDRETVVDSNGASVATIEIVAVDVIRLADADDTLAIAEGEEYSTAAGWRAEHERFWRDEVLPAWPTATPPQLDDATEVLVQWFRLVGERPPTR